MVATGHYLTATPAGNAFWSGGTDGPEGSVLVMGMILLLLVALLAIYGRKKPAAPYTRPRTTAMAITAMRLWLNRTGEVSLREQLVTQVILAILCKELAARPAAAQHPRAGPPLRHPRQHGQRRLPRTGARRAGLSSATAAACYVRASRPAAPLSPETGRRVRRRPPDWRPGGKGAQAGRVRDAAAQPLAPLALLEPPSRWLVIEPDPELRRIVIHEMQQALALPVAGCTPEECADPGDAPRLHAGGAAQQGRNGAQAAARRNRADHACRCIPSR